MHARHAQHCYCSKVPSRAGGRYAEYLGDVWDGWQQATKKFVEEDLVAVRDGMLGEAKEQQASEVFLRTLGELIEFNHVRIEGDRKSVV